MRALAQVSKDEATALKNAFTILGADAEPPHEHVTRPRVQPT